MFFFFFFFRFFFFVFCSVFSVCNSFFVPFYVCSSVFFFFFRFSVSSSVCCSQIPENPFIGYFVESKGIRVEGSGFLGLRVPGLTV